MGCIRLGSCSSSSQATPFTETSPNPNPHRFRIEESEIVNGNTIMLVRYPDCTTFDGLKLLLLKGKHLLFNKLDPHFLDDINHPVIARFIPDEDGYIMALAAAKNY